MAVEGPKRPGWKVCQLRTECQETDKILRTKIEINERTKIKIEIARDGPILISYDNPWNSYALHTNFFTFAHRSFEVRPKVLRRTVQTFQPG